MLKLVHRTVRYGARTALDDVSLEIAAGERVAILGRNGAGKSTLLRALMACGDVAYVPPDESREIALTGWDYVMLGRTARLSAWRRPSATDETVVARALADVGMADFARRRLEDVSSGERRRLALALALATEASAFLLDEPLAHVDLRGRATFFDLLARMPRTIVMSVHEFPLPSGFFTRTILLEAGRIVADGTPTDVETAFWGISNCAVRDIPV